MAFTLVTVSGTYLESGVPASGKVTFKRSTSLQDAAGNLISPNDLRTATLDANGSISIQLEATDQAGIDPSGAVYTVTEQINKQGRRVYTMQVPAASAGTGIDLADVAPVVAGPQNFTYALQSSLNTETTARTSADNTLQGNITAEASTRAAADTTLGTEIAAKPDTFLELTDTPAAYTGQAGKAAIVNPGETGVIFGTVSGGGASLSNNTPLVESGTGAAGTGTAASRDDHVHPAEDLSGYATTAALNTETSARTAGDTASAQKSANLSDLANAATARTNLGLGTASTNDVPASGNASTTQVVKGDDTRLTDARTPTAHKASHATGGSDALSGNLDANARVIVAKAGAAVGIRRTVNFIDGAGITSTVSDAGGIAERIDVTIAAAATESNLTLSDVTTDDVSITKHGFAPKAPNDTGRFLRGDGSWATPPDTGFANPMTTQDDLIVGGASGAPGRLGKGTDGQVLTVDPTTHHLVWATPAGGGSGTVTSVALTVPSDLSVSGSPITGAGTLAVTANTQAANLFKAGPSSGSAAAPTYRVLAGADLGKVIPALSGHPDTVPASPNAMDDEFDAGSLDAKWTKLNMSAVVTELYTASHAVWSLTNSAVNIRGAYQGSITTGTWRCKVEMGGLNTNNACAGLFLMESATSKCLSLSGMANSGAYLYRYDKWTNSTTFSTGTFGANLSAAVVWLEIQIDATNITLRGSTNGYRYEQILQETKTTSFTTAPDRVGIYISGFNSLSAWNAAFDWFRKVA